jgi:hypothetical protein
MKIEIRMCDVCRKEVDQHYPLNLSAQRQNNPTGEFLDLDFCSVKCLIALPFIAEVVTQIAEQTQP